MGSKLYRHVFVMVYINYVLERIRKNIISLLSADFFAKGVLYQYLDFPFPNFNFR